MLMVINDCIEVGNHLGNFIQPNQWLKKSSDCFGSEEAG